MLPRDFWLTLRALAQATCVLRLFIDSNRVWPLFLFDVFSNIPVCVVGIETAPVSGLLEHNQKNVDNRQISMRFV